jgi:DNA-directed RNA polymerase subunit M/transcription elongation factor TFIIS
MGDAGCPPEGLLRSGLGKGGEMEETAGKRTCPACGGDEYAFRGRKAVEREPGKREVETKYRCKKCEHEWKVVDRQSR